MKSFHKFTHWHKHARTYTNLINCSAWARGLRCATIMNATPLFLSQTYSLTQAHAHTHTHTHLTSCSAWARGLRCTTTMNATPLFLSQTYSLAQAHARAHPHPHPPTHPHTHTPDKLQCMGQGLALRHHHKGHHQRHTSALTLAAVH